MSWNCDSIFVGYFCEILVVNYDNIYVVILSVQLFLYRKFFIKGAPPFSYPSITCTVQ